RSSQVVVALGGLRRGEYDRFYSSTTEPDQPLTESGITDLLASAGFGTRAAVSRARTPAIGCELQVRGQSIGAIAEGRSAEYKDTERTALEVFASYVALSLTSASEWDAMWQSVARVERAHELAVEVLLAVSSHAATGENLADFYRRLARTMGELVGANRVLFW